MIPLTNLPTMISSEGEQWARYNLPRKDGKFWMTSSKWRKITNKNIWNSSRNTWISSHFQHDMSMLTLSSGCGSIMLHLSCFTTLRYPAKNMFITRYEIYHNISSFLQQKYSIKLPFNKVLNLVLHILKIFGSAKHTAHGARKVIMRKKNGSRPCHKLWDVKNMEGSSQNGAAFILDMMIKYQNWSGNRQFWDNP